MQRAAVTLGRPSAFASERILKKHNSSVPLSSIRTFLSTSDEHSLFKRVAPIKYVRGVHAYRKRMHGEMDVKVMSPRFKFFNRHYRYALLLIDAFTKKIFMSPLKRIDAGTVANATRELFARSGRFERIVTDGGEYSITF